MESEVKVALLEQKAGIMQQELDQLKNETLVQMQATLVQLERYISRLHNIALGMAIYFVVDSLGLVGALKALL